MQYNDLDALFHAAKNGDEKTAAELGGKMKENLSDEKRQMLERALHDSDLTIGNIVSEQGNLSVTNKSGSILTGENKDKTDEEGNPIPGWYREGEYIHGRDITLEARDSIGTEDKSFLVEATANTDRFVYTAYVVSPDGETGKTQFGGSIVEDETTGAYMVQNYTAANSPRGSLYDADGDGYEARPILTLGDGTDTAIIAMRKDTLREYREDNQADDTILNLRTEKGDIYVTERTGDINSEDIQAGGNVVLYTDSSDITLGNLEAGGNVCDHRYRHHHREYHPQRRQHGAERCERCAERNRWRGRR